MVLIMSKTFKLRGKKSCTVTVFSRNKMVKFAIGFPVKCVHDMLSTHEVLNKYLLIND